MFSTQGCEEELAPFFPVQMPWTAFRSSEYGYSRFTFHNGTHMSVEQVGTPTDGASSVIDSFTIVKETHKAYIQLQKTVNGYL